MSKRPELNKPILDFINADAQKPAAEPSQATDAPSTAEVLAEPAARPVFREREATRNMSVNVPKSLYEELRAFMKLTDTPMTEVLVEGAKKELARLKKQYGIET